MARILCVDDDDLFRPMLVDVLGRLGHEVVVATNGHEAVARFREQSFDVAITDIVMPDKDGLETIRELLQIDPGVPLIAMSGGGRVNANNYLELARRLGARAILAKPFSMQDVGSAIDGVMAGASVRSRG